jgi:hypothetical protein
MTPFSELKAEPSEARAGAVELVGHVNHSMIKNRLWNLN